MMTRFREDVRVLAKMPEVGRGRWTNHMVCPWSSGLWSGELGWATGTFPLPCLPHPH